MVKLGRGGRRHLPHRPEPMPLFPPGELPVFGPPPVNHRRPPPPRRGFPPPISRPPPPLMRPPPPLRLCPPPPSFPPGQRRQGHLIPPVRPLLQTPILPPRGVPFGRGMPVRGIPLRGRGRGGPFNRQGKNMKKMKNKKMNKPSKEEEFYCETCDRCWETEAELQEHLDEHVKCGREGCAFSAAPKLVAIHIKLQHETGLFKKISSQDDVKKWIEERRKNYPTKENMERKAATLQEMEKRGEPVKDERPLKTHHQSRTLKGISKPGNRKHVKRGPKTFKARFSEDDEELFCLRVAPFRGIRGLSPAKDEEHYEDEIWNETFDDAGASEQALSTLQALASSYASCSESEADEGPEEVQSVVEKPSPDEVPQNVVTTPAEPCPVVEDQPRNEGKPWPQKRKRHVFPSLLEMLLKDEIWRERSVILQCIRYCVENNFFHSKAI